MNKLEQAARQAFETWWEREGQEFLYALNTTTDDDIKLVAEIAWKNGAYCAEQAEQEPVLITRVAAPQSNWKAEQEQKPVAEVVLRNQTVGFGRTEERKDVMFLADVDVGTKLYAKSQQQAEQEPVAYLCPSFVDNYATGKYETCERTDYGAFPTYAAPVRTKDLTDDEINALIDKSWIELMTIKEFARAVIAADREKNK